MRRQKRIYALGMKVNYCERRAFFYVQRYENMRSIVRTAKSMGNIDHARAYSLEAWRARQCLNYARDDRRAALAELEAAQNEKS